MRTRVKVCGITRLEDASLVVDLGADAVGVIFHPGSPRFIDIATAKKIRKVVPAFVNLVGVFVNLQADEIRQVYANVGLDLVQLHGDESPEFAESLGLPYIKALSKEHSMGLNKDYLGYDSARGFLLDASTEHSYGGTGLPFELGAWPKVSKAPVILAGGLGPDYLVEPIQSLKPYAVDLNSGVEFEPGKKDPDKLAACFQQLGSSNDKA